MSVRFGELVLAGLILHSHLLTNTSSALITTRKYQCKLPLTFIHIWQKNLIKLITF